MIYYIPENKLFENRKEAKIYLGTANFNRLLKTNQIIFINIENSLAFYESVSSNTTQIIKD